MMLEFREATNRLRQWPPALRWAALLVPAILLVAASGWYYNASRSDPTVVLLEGQPLNDAQLAVVVQAFAKAKLTNYSIREHCLYVPRTQLGAYLTAVADSGVLPKGLQSNSEQVIGDVRLLESERDRERRVSHARERDLALAIRAMDGIQDAFVQFDETQQRGLQGGRLVTASVGVLPHKDQSLDSQKINTIRLLVAAAKAGLDPAQVHLTDLRSGRAYLGNASEPTGWPATEEQLRLQQAWEQTWQTKLRGVLHFVPQAEVAVSVELPPLPAAAATEPHAAPPLAAPAPRRLAVSIGVPRSYLVRVWQARMGPNSTRHNPPADQFAPLQAEITQRIRQAVLALTPAGPQAPQTTVAVTTFDDLLPATPMGPAAPTRLVGDGALRQKLGLGIIIAGVLGLMAVQWGWARLARRRSWQPVVVRPIPGESPGTHTVGHNEPVPFPEVEEQQLRTTLTEVVRRDPDEAARVLSRWIARAG